MSKQMKLHHLVALFAVLVLTFGVAVMPAQAASNPFASFADSVSQRFQRFMLKLPGNKPGQTVLAQSAKAMAEVTTLTYSLDAKAEIKPEEGSPTTINLNFSGPAKLTSAYEPTSSQQDVKIKGQVGVEGMTISGEAHLKIDGETTYLKIVEFPATMMGFSEASIDELKSTWIKLDNESTQEESETKKELTADQKAQLEKATQDLIKKTKVSQAKKERLGDANVFVVETTLADQDLVEYVKTVERITEPELDQAKIDESAQELTKTLDSVDELKMVLYIDQNSFYLRRMTMPITANMTELSAQAAEDETRPASVPVAGNLKLDLIVDFSKFNEPVTFTAPTDSVPLEEVMSGFMPGMMGGQSSLMAPPTVAQPKKMAPRPTELPELTEDEKAMLKQYGLEVEDLY